MKKLIDKVISLMKKYKEVISYLIFGVLTTIVNILAYELFTKIFHVDYLVSTVIAWVISVAFAYVTNKIFVFESKTNTKIEILKEITSFVGFRLLSGIMDIVFMYITVDIFSFNDSLMKIASNVVVVVLNYLFSKLFIFKKKKEKVN